MTKILTLVTLMAFLTGRTTGSYVLSRSARNFLIGFGEADQTISFIQKN